MRTKEIRKWINEGGSLPQDLTQEEHKYLSRLGWRKMVMEYDNGQKEFEWHYLHEEWHGEWKKWYPNGQKFCERHYLRGEKHGKQEGWWENGKKSFEQHCFHGMKHGVFKEWYEDGDLLIDEEYFYGNKIKETS